MRRWLHLQPRAAGHGTRMHARGCAGVWRSGAAPSPMQRTPAAPRPPPRSFNSKDNLVQVLSAGGTTCDIAVAGLDVESRLLDKGLTFSWPTYKCERAGAGRSMPSGGLRGCARGQGRAARSARLPPAHAHAAHATRTCSGGKTIAVPVSPVGATDMWAFLKVPPARTA